MTAFLSEILFLFGCTSNNTVKEQKGNAYQSTVQLEHEIITDLFVDLSCEDNITNSHLTVEGEISHEENYTIYQYAVTSGRYLKINASMIANPNSANRFAFFC